MGGCKQPAIRNHETGMNLKIIALSNFYYREVALNWVRHIEKLGIENYEIVCLDTPCRKYLHKHGVTTSLYAKKLSLKQILQWALAKSGIKHYFRRVIKRYRSLRYIAVRLGYNLVPRTISDFRMIWKLEMVRKYLQDGYDVVLSDTDALWFKDPVEDLVAGNSCDIIVSTAYRETAYPPRFKEKYGYTPCMGWVVFKNTPGTIRFLDSLLALDEQQKKESKYSDQAIFSHSLMDRDPDIRRSDLGDIFVTDGIEILALNQNLVKRGGPVPDTYVWHPLSHKSPEYKKLAFGKHWLL